MTRASAVLPNPAPWAEVVPGMGPVIVDDLLTIPDDGFLYEVVEGVLIRMAGSGFAATRLALRIGALLLAYADGHGLGIVTGADGVYKFAGAETGLIPDVGFVAISKVGQIVDEAKPIPFAPDLAVEVASPSQSAAEMAAKAHLYLTGGTRLVWVVWPSSAHIDIWSSERTLEPVDTLNRGDTLDGGAVLPGFTHPVAAIFGPSPQAPAP